MRNRLMGTMFTAVVLVLSPVIFAQNGQQTGVQKAPAASNKPFDPHDISGIWVPGGTAVISNDRPPLTDWGKAKWSTTKSSDRKTPLSFGYFIDQKEWNDPVQWCDPAGYPRQLWYTAGGRANFRFVQTATEVLEFLSGTTSGATCGPTGEASPAMPSPGGSGIQSPIGMEIPSSLSHPATMNEAGWIWMVRFTATK